VFLGIDLGTSELKLVLLADDHRVAGVEREPLAVARPQPLWSEQSPADWWAALEAALQRLGARHAAALRSVRAIGLSGQMHGAVLLDAAGDVLRPAILWNDGRSAAQCAELERRAPALRRIAGNGAMPGFTAPKLLWVREHEPHVFERTACVLLPKDWLRWRLTGERVTDCSDASGTLWLDVGARRWSDELLAACGLARAHMPEVVEGSAPAGRLGADLARRWGLAPDVVVAGGGGDNAASAVGIGAVAPGQGFVSLGTSGVIFVCTDRFLPEPRRAVHAFCHALPNRWHQMSVMLSAASALTWAARLGGQDSEAALLAQAEALTPEERARAPLFLPYLAGERTPHNDPHAQGVLFGLRHEHGSGALAHAVIEGVAFGLRDGWLALDAGQRGRVTELDLVGGGARSATWAQLIATVLGVPLVMREGAHLGGAVGAARLAWLAWLASVGLDASEAAVCRLAPVQRRFEPDTAAAGALLERHARFVSLFEAVRGRWT
jgi:xylulokinase